MGNRDHKKVKKYSNIYYIQHVAIRCQKNPNKTRVKQNDNKSANFVIPEVPKHVKAQHFQLSRMQIEIMCNTADLFTLGRQEAVWSKISFCYSCSMCASCIKNTVPLCFSGHTIQVKHVDCFSITAFKKKLRQILVIFAVWHIHFIWEEFEFAPTMLYIVHLLKVHCHSVSLGK